jgi:lysozyme family protein
MSFETAFRFTLSHEGGYVNDVRDPGLETNFGHQQTQLSQSRHQVADA